MPRLIKLYVLAAFLALLWASPANASRKALVIGNNSYPGNRLTNAVNDARSVAMEFNKLGYQTTLGTDLDRRSMNRKIRAFSESLEPGDVAVMYYAGHGMQMNGENYLIPIDFKVGLPQQVGDSAISLSSVLASFKARNNSTQIIILDACRNNPFKGTRSITDGWASMSTSAGTLLAFGTSPGSTASDDPAAPHGLFTLALLKYLDSSPLDAEMMLSKVREQVILDSGGNQVPWTASSLTGSFHFIPKYDAHEVNIAYFPGIPKQRALVGMARSLGNDRINYTPSMTATDAGISSDGLDERALSRQAESTLESALASAQRGEYHDSVRGLSALLSIDPASSIALRILGLVFNLMGQHETAIRSLTRAVQIDPEDFRAYYYRCLVSGSSNPAAAVGDCERALAINPAFSDAHLGLSNALFSMGELDAAKVEAQKAVFMNSRSPVNRSMLGKVLSQAGYRVAAEREFQRAISVETSETEGRPSDPKAQINP
jgi:tetratricopeptide (TPR) repeat protein